MSDLDRVDPRDGQLNAAFDRAWRNESTEQPSARLDAAILAAAREAVGDRNETPAATHVRIRPRQRWNQWTPLAAAAAVAGLAFTLVQILPRDPERAPTPAAQESATVAAPADAPTPAAARPAAAEPQGMVAPRARDTVGPAAQEQESAPDPTAAPQLIPALPAAIPVESTVGAPAATSQAPPAGSNESRADLHAARSKAVDAAMTEQAAIADDWVEKITAMYAAGDIAAAEHALQAFRAAVPDADRYLPESLKEWAARVR